MNYRKMCKECPWKNENNHSIKFRQYAEKMKSLGKIENHKCHMISNDLWGYFSMVTDKNICIGSKNFMNKKNRINMKEIRILLNESTFTQLCKMGFIQHKTSISSRTDVYITKADMVELTTGKIVEKEIDGDLFKIALQDIGIELIREILRRSPMYSDIVERIILNR